MNLISYGELDRLVGEVLPERTVLSTVTGPSGGADEGAKVIYACHTTYSPGSHGVLGLLGLGSSPTYTQTCTPAGFVTQ